MESDSVLLPDFTGPNGLQFSETQYGGNHMSDVLKKIGFLAAGAGIGATVVLLTAPRSGKHTRARIRNSANRTVHRIEEIRDDVRSTMSEMIDDTSEAIASAISSGRHATRFSAECVEETLDKVRHRMDEGRKRVEG